MQVRMTDPTGGNLDDLTFALPQDRIRVIILDDKRFLDSGKNDRTHNTETGLSLRLISDFSDR
jgi:hypothetical protein